MCRMSSTGKKKCVYIGIRNAKWPPTPSLYYQSTKLVASEREIIHSFSYKFPKVFDAEVPSSFKNLASLRHYGMPLRLMDVTTNPLVALYFACCPPPPKRFDQSDDDAPEVKPDFAVVHLLTFEEDEIYDWTNPFFQEMMNLAFEAANMTAATIRRISPGIVTILGKDIKSQPAWDKITQPKLVESPHFTDRQRAQFGQFVFFPPLFEIGGTKNTTVKRVPLPGSRPNGMRKPDEYNNQLHSSRRILIPESNKRDILASLSQKGISHTTLFPEDIDSAADDFLRNLNRGSSTVWSRAK